MSSIWHALIKSYAMLATIPVVPFILVYQFMKFKGADRKRAIRLAMDVTTPFLFGIVGYLLNSRLHTSFGPFFLLLVMLIGGGLIGNAQNRVRGKIEPLKLLRAVWRLSFFGMSALYLILMLLLILFPVKSV